MVIAVIFVVRFFISYQNVHTFTNKHVYQHQWIAQRQVGPVSVYCDGVGCHVLCL